MFSLIMPIDHFVCHTPRLTASNMLPESLDLILLTKYRMEISSSSDNLEMSLSHHPSDLMTVSRTSSDKDHYRLGNSRLFDPRTRWMLSQRIMIENNTSSSSSSMFSRSTWISPTTPAARAMHQTICSRTALLALDHLDACSCQRCQ